MDQLTVLLRPAAAGGGQTKSALISSENSLASSLITCNWIQPIIFCVLRGLNDIAFVSNKLQRCNVFRALVKSLYQKWGSVLTFDELTSLRVRTEQGPLQLICLVF